MPKKVPKGPGSAKPSGEDAETREDTAPAVKAKKALRKKAPKGRDSHSHDNAIDTAPADNAIDTAPASYRTDCIYRDAGANAERHVFVGMQPQTVAAFSGVAAAGMVLAAVAVVVHGRRELAGIKNTVTTEGSPLIDSVEGELC